MHVTSRSRSKCASAPKQLIMCPFNFSTVLERNLSASWYKEIPTIMVDAKFDHLKVMMVVVNSIIRLVSTLLLTHMTLTCDQYTCQLYVNQNLCE